MTIWFVQSKVKTFSSNQEQSAFLTVKITVQVMLRCYYQRLALDHATNELGSHV
jgi:hypothetical protein